MKIYGIQDRLYYILQLIFSVCTNPDDIDIVSNNVIIVNDYIIFFKLVINKYFLYQIFLQPHCYKCIII